MINFLWVGWFALLAAANLYVARNFDEDVWVKFKVFGISAAMVVFMIPQVLWLNGKATAGGIGDRAPMSDRAQRLRERLVREFAPLELLIEDESHLHAGHAGAAGGASHFRVRIVAQAFGGLAPRRPTSPGLRRRWRPDTRRDPRAGASGPAAPPVS